MIQDWRKMITKKGKMLVVLTLAQANHRIDMLLFPDKLPNEMVQFNIGDLVVVEGELGFDQLRQQRRLIVQKILSENDARIFFAKTLNLFLREEQHAVLKDLKSFVDVCTGNCPIKVVVQTKQFKVQIHLNEDWRIHPDQKNLDVLEKIIGKDSFKLTYLD